MTGYLSRLVLRSTRSDAGLRPRPSAMYEAPTADPAVRRTPVEPPALDTRAEQALSEEVATEPADEVSREPRTRPGQPAATVGEPTETNESAAATQQPTASSAAGPAPPLAALRPAVESGIRGPVERADSGVDAAGSTASRRTEPDTTSRTAAFGQQAFPAAQHVVAGTAQELPTNELRRRAGQLAFASDTAATTEHGVRAGETARSASQERAQASVVPTGPAWGEPVVVVPRLEVPVEVGEPEVNVTIGRIEIVRPAVAEPAPRPAPRRRTTSAPDLAQYLKSRSGR
ncbi:hypothetical protein EV650_0907 [Kribbella kalugense]|uniref:Uncharacterized protein n=1 Tax=Kribbella kalugense TaxID=2512221 RepID=A0A4R7ZWF4_9ACTN|nr:hypothetical protein EV650_0907 [Kribbella kalugense]